MINLSIDACELLANTPIVRMTFLDWLRLTDESKIRLALAFEEDVDIELEILEAL